jgi:starvation-inducible DNA-binding protein
MAKRNLSTLRNRISAQPRLQQRAREIQAYGTVNFVLSLDLEEPVRLEMTEQLNQMLADTITLRDLYKKSHWQVAGPTFYQLHLLFDKHYEEQTELVDSIAERIQLLGGVSIAMAADVAETTQIERPPRGRE